MPYHLFLAVFWKQNRAVVAVGLHRSGCCCLHYLLPRDCSPAHTYPEAAQLHKQPLQTWASTAPGQTVRLQQDSRGSNESFFKG